MPQVWVFRPGTRTSTPNQVPQGGYAPNGNILQHADSVMGTWNFTYDTLNRLAQGTATAGADNGLTLGWTYDRYGNRWAQNATGTGNATAVQPQLTFYGSNGVNTNRIDGPGPGCSPSQAYCYDAAGNLASPVRTGDDFRQANLLRSPRRFRWRGGCPCRGLPRHTKWATERRR